MALVTTVVAIGSDKYFSKREVIKESTVAPPTLKRSVI